MVLKRTVLCFCAILFLSGPAMALTQGQIETLLPGKRIATYYVSKKDPSHSAVEVITIGSARFMAACYYDEPRTNEENGEEGILRVDFFRLKGGKAQPIGSEELGKGQRPNAKWLWLKDLDGDGRPEVLLNYSDTAYTGNLAVFQVDKAGSFTLLGIINNSVWEFKETAQPGALISAQLCIGTCAAPRIFRLKAGAIENVSAQYPAVYRKYVKSCELKMQKTEINDLMLFELQSAVLDAYLTGGLLAEREAYAQDLIVKYKKVISQLKSEKRNDDAEWWSEHLEDIKRLSKMK